MPNFTAKIGAITNKQHSPEEVRTGVLSGELTLDYAREYATERLLACRIGEARTVMSGVMMYLKQHVNGECTKELLRQNQDQWEFNTAFAGGNPALGFDLHAQYFAYRNGGLAQAVSLRHLKQCYEKCVEENDVENAKELWALIQKHSVSSGISPDL